MPGPLRPCETVKQATQFRGFRCLTFALVLIGCGAAVIGGMGTGATSIDIFGIAAAFGLTIVAMAATPHRIS
jgi:glycerol uptake facilitator-like aquaporin